MLNLGCAHGTCAPRIHRVVRSNGVDRSQRLPNRRCDSRTRTKVDPARSIHSVLRDPDGDSLVTPSASANELTIGPSRRLEDSMLDEVEEHRTLRQSGSQFCRSNARHARPPTSISRNVRLKSLALAPESQ